MFKKSGKFPQCGPKNGRFMGRFHVHFSSGWAFGVCCREGGLAKSGLAGSYPPPPWGVAAKPQTEVWL